jgi:4-hydroxy-tetrahydrodipicolinate reductase
MKLALLGYGKMGREIEKIALKRGHEIALKIGSKNSDELTIENLKKADVAIDFSLPTSAESNIKLCFKSSIPIISGTTGWLDKYSEVCKVCEKENGSFIYASNFSLGVNLFFELNSFLANMMSSHNDYDVNMKEIHHIHKLDAPSGTAISLADQILEKSKSKQKWSIQENIDPSTLNIEAERTNEVPGTHRIVYESEIDSISIEHKAHNRQGFALGVIIASEWIQNRKGVFSMKDVIFTA